MDKPNEVVPEGGTQIDPVKLEKSDEMYDISFGRLQLRSTDRKSVV